MDAAKNPYKIKMDSNGDERWVPGAWLTRSCVVDKPSAAAADKFSPGKWSLFVSPVSGYRRDDPTSRMTTSGAKAPPLTIKDLATRLP